MADVSSNSDTEHVDDMESEETIQQMRNPNTIRKTASDIRKFVDWLKGMNEMNPPECIPLKELDQYLANFFSTAKKLDGEEYEPESLKSFQCSINRYLIEKQVDVNVLVDREFKHSRDTLLSKRKELKRLGKGLKQNKAEPFTPQEIDLLYSKNLLGTGNPKALINTMFLNNALFFGMESRREHARLRWGDVQLKTTSVGIEYLERNGITTKKFDNRITSTIIADPDSARCPVQAYRIFAAKRPKVMMSPESPFYIGVARQAKQGDCWYVSNALGKNTIGAIVKSMCEEAGITGRKMNYSARKSAVSSEVTVQQQSVYPHHVYVERTSDEYKNKWRYIEPKPNGQKREHGEIEGQMDASELSAVEEKVSRILWQTGVLDTKQRTVNGVNYSKEYVQPSDSSMNQKVGEPSVGFTDITAFAVKIENADDDYGDNVPVVHHIDTNFNQPPSSTSSYPGTSATSSHAETIVQQHHNPSPIKPAQTVVGNEIAKLEAERLAVEQERLMVARERLELEKQLLQIDKERVLLERHRLENTRQFQNIP